MTKYLVRFFWSARCRLHAHARKGKALSMRPVVIVCAAFAATAVVSCGAQTASSVAAGRDSDAGDTGSGSAPGMDGDAGDTGSGDEPAAATYDASCPDGSTPAVYENWFPGSACAPSEEGQSCGDINLEGAFICIDGHWFNCLGGNPEHCANGPEGAPCCPFWDAPSTLPFFAPGRVCCVAGSVGTCTNFHLHYGGTCTNAADAQSGFVYPPAANDGSTD